MTDEERNLLVETYRLQPLNSVELNHLLAWLEHRHYQDEWDATLQDIVRALEWSPDLMEDHTWEEIEDIGATLDGRRI